MRPVIPLANVTVHGGLDPEGETYRKVRLTMIGNPACVVMYSNMLGDGKWEPVDRLTNATVAEGDNRWTISGISDEMVERIGLSPDNAVVRWDVEVIGCLDCH
jgi:hypothetical protein